MATNIGFSGDGGIFLEVGADIDGALKGLETVNRKIEGVGKNASKLNQTKIDLKPTGRRDLDDAGRSAEQLGRKMGDAGKQAKSVNVSPALSQGLDGASRKAGELDKALGGAAEEAKRLGDGVDVTPSTRALQGLTSAARDLAPALSAAAMGGAILTKGWNRLTAIDTAQAKLKGLGHDAENIEKIMESANKSVSGTAFGLADATTVAANLVAQNIEPGEELARVLTNVADASAIAGISLTEMGSIYTKIAAGDSVMAEELNQLGDRGLPILNMLAEEMGTTAGAVRDLASEGAIGFAEFDSAIQRSLGGSAQAMGSSIIGTLDNVGAAAGRLGAALQAPVMGGVQSGANATISALNSLTGTVNSLIGAWDSLPDPVKTVVSAMAAGTVATKTLNSSMGQAAVGGIKSFTSGIIGSEGAVTGWAKNMRTAFMDASKHQRGLANDATASAMAMSNGWDFADRQVSAFGHTVVGTMQGSAAAVKNGVGGIVNALGGPLMLGLSAATWALGEMVAESQNLKRISELAEEASSSTSHLWEELAANAKEGDITASIGAVEASLQSFLDTQKEIADVDTNRFWGSIGAGLKGIGHQLNIFSEQDWRSVTDDLYAMWDTQEEAEAFNKALENTGLSVDELSRAATGSRSNFESVMEILQRAGDATSPLQLHLNESRRAFEEAAAGAELAGEKSILVSEGFSILSDEAADADDKVDALTNTLRAMAGFDMTLDESLRNMREQVNKILEDTDLADAESGLGAALFGGDGLLNYEYDNAIELQETLLSLQESYSDLISKGEDSAEVFNEHISPSLDALADKYGMTRAELDEYLERLGFVPETAQTVLDLSTVEAMDGLREFWGMFEDGKAVAGEPIMVTVDNVEEAKKNFQDLGIEWERIQGDTFVFDADASSALAEIDKIIAASSQINDEEGITFTSNSGEVMNAMDELGLKISSLGDGEFQIESNTAGEIALMMDLGLLVEDPKTGDLTIDSNILEVLTSAYELDKRDGKVTEEFHKVTQEQKRITYWENQGLSRSEAVKQQGPTPWAGNQHGGLAGYATGGKLPMTGAGTERTDGILGVGSDGVPTAWVDKGEFVTNRESTLKYEPLLWAINNDDALGVITAALTGLPGYASGGQVEGAANAGADAAAFNAGVQVSADTGGALGALQTLAVQAAALEEPKIVQVDASVDAATSGLESVAEQAEGLEIEPLPVEIDSDFESLQEDLEQFQETEPIELELSTEALQAGVSDAQSSLNSLSEQQATPTVGLDTERLESGARDSTSTLDTLNSETPVPTADLDHAQLDSGVDSSMEQLHMVGGAKATSVSDVDNSSALTNIQGVIDALNRMPVERTIKVVAHGSTPALATGGEVPGLATGGTIAGTSLPTTGRGTAEVDGFLGIDGEGMPLVRVDAGEYVTNRKASKEYRTELELINAGKFPKLDNLEQLAAGARKAPGLATGGVVSPEQLLAFASGKTVNGHTAPGSLEGSPYIWGGGLFSNWGDCSGAMSGLAALAVGVNPAGRKFATMNQGDWLFSHGFRPGLGPADTSFNLGWFNGGPWGGHTSGSIGGTNVEMGGGRGNGQIGGAAASPSNAQFTDHAHIALGELVAIDRYERLADIMQTRMPAPAGGYSSTGGHGVSMGGGHGVTLHDEGGWLQPGTFAYNGLGTPEPVLKPEHWSLVEQLIRLFPEHSKAIMQAGKDIDNAASNMQKALRELGDPDSDTTVIARAMAEALGETLSFTGMDGLSSDVSGLIKAENTLNEARLQQAERAQAVADAELALAEARKNLHEIENEDLSDDAEKRSEKVANAEKNVRDARAGKDGKVDTEKVAEAEKKLARARKEASKDAAEAEQKRSESIVKATDDIASAEQALDDARQAQLSSLDMTVHSVMPQLYNSVLAAKSAVDSLTSTVSPQLAAMGGAGAQAAGMLSQASGALGALATAAGPAGMSVAAAVAAIQSALQVLEIIANVAGRIGEATAGNLRGAASGIELFADSIGRLGDVLDTVTKLTEAQIDASAREVDARKNVQDAQERLMEAQRNSREEEAANTRAVQQAEWDLAMSRWEASQVAGSAEVNLAEIREKGIFETLTYATAADRAAITSAQDVATNRAQLAAAQARMEQAAFENALQVADANNELERAQILASIEMDRLTNASVQLANAQALASGEIAGATALERYLEGAAMVKEGEADIAAGGSTKLQGILNPFRWFKGDTFTGREMEAQGKDKISEGEAMMKAYAKQAESDLLALPEEVQAQARAAMEKIVGKQDGGFESVAAKIADVLGGTGGKASQALASAQSREALHELNALIYESKHRMDAAKLEAEREEARLDREQKRNELEWKKSDLETQVGAWEERNYLAEMVELAERQLAEHKQENQQVGELGSALDDVNNALNRDSSVMMSIGGSGWGDAPVGASSVPGGFGGLREGDLSLWESARLENGWINREIERVMVPAIDSIGDAIATGGLPSGLPDTVVDGIYNAAGAEQAAADGISRNSQANSTAELAGILSKMLSDSGDTTNVNTQFTGAVTVQSAKADDLVKQLEKTLARS